MNLYKLLFVRSLSIPRVIKAFDFVYNYFYENKIVLINKKEFVAFLKNQPKHYEKTIDYFKEVLEEQHWVIEKGIFINFFCYMFYERSKRYFFNKIGKDWYLKNPYKSTDKVMCDSIKRNYYYDFLNELKHKENHNAFLIKFLRILR